MTPAAGNPTPLGLSTYHSAKQAYYQGQPRDVVPGTSPVLRIAAHGNFVGISSHNPAYKPPEGKKRGKVRTFSAKARARLFAEFAKVDRSKVARHPRFLTLTYHHEWPADPTEQYRQLELLWSAYKRKAPRAGAIWKREFQKRGAPHWHLIIFNGSWVPREWIAATWTRIVDPGNAAHERAGTKIERCRSWDESGRYVAKYIGKADDSPASESIGKVWGRLSEAYIPSTVREYTLSFRQWSKIKRYLVAILAAKGREITDRGLWVGLWAGIPAEIGHVLWLNTLYDDADFGLFLDPIHVDWLSL